MQILASIKKQVMTMLLSFFLLILQQFTKIDEKMVLFAAFDGRGVLDNPKALFESMLANPRFASYTFVWALTQQTDIVGSRVVKKGSFKYYYYLVKAKYWVFNYKMPEFLKKRAGQVYLQTWHGTPLKRLAHDLVDTGATYYRSKQSYQEMVASYDKDAHLWDYLISPNQFSTTVFLSAFQIPREKVLQTGYPRNDVLFEPSDAKIKELKQRYQLPQDKKIILYAPTWRDDTYNLKGYRFDLPINFKQWHDTLGDDYLIIFKPHYLIANQIDIPSDLSDFVLVLKATADINDLYLMSDQLVTDYSSVFFDYASLNRPIYFYMPDLKRYESELRGFYLKVPDALPNDITHTETALLDQISNTIFDYQRLTAFNQKFNGLQDGHASEKVLEEVFSAH